MPITEPSASIEALGGPTVATIGTFDGVHLGHRALLRQVRHEAEARSARSVALVFREQPRAFFNPGKKVSYLCDFEARIAMLGETGVDEIVELEFGPTIQKLSSEEFVVGLRDRIGLEALIVRAVFYDLVELGEEAEIDGETVLGVWSCGQFFSIGPIGPAEEV